VVLAGFLAISVIFSRQEYEILPPPPPFPNVGLGDEPVKEEKKHIFKKIEKPQEVIKSEEEIQRAIEGIKKEGKKKNLINIFKKKDIEKSVEKPEVMPRTKEEKDDIGIVEEKIHKARMSLMDFKFDDAKMAYVNIMMIYNKLDDKDKSKVYQDIKDFYDERKSAEKFSK